MIVNYFSLGPQLSFPLYGKYTALNMVLASKLVPDSILEQVPRFKAGRHRDSLAGILKARTLIRVDFDGDKFSRRDVGSLTNVTLESIKYNFLAQPSTSTLFDRDEYLCHLHRHAVYISTKMSDLNQMNQERECLQHLKRRCDSEEKHHLMVVNRMIDDMDSSIRDMQSHIKASSETVLNAKQMIENEPTSGRNVSLIRQVLEKIQNNT